MSEETLPKGQTVEPQAEGQEQQPVQSVSIQDILSTYPIDRDKCRDVLLVEMSRNMTRIADSLEAVSQGIIVLNTHLSKMAK